MRVELVYILLVVILSKKNADVFSFHYISIAFVLQNKIVKSKKAVVLYSFIKWLEVMVPNIMAKVPNIMVSGT